MSWFSDRWGRGGPFGWAGDQIKKNGPAFLTGTVDTLAGGLTGGIPGLIAGGISGWGNALSGGGGPTLKGTLGAAAGGGLAGAAFGGESPLASVFGAGSGGGAGGATASAPSDSALASGTYGDAADATATALSRNAPASLSSRLGSAFGDVGSWAAKHPETIANVGTAIGQAPLNEARAKQLAAEASMSEYDLERRKRRDLAMQPILQALAGQIQSRYANGGGIAPNRGGQIPGRSSP